MTLYRLDMMGPNNQWSRGSLFIYRKSIVGYLELDRRLSSFSYQYRVVKITTIDELNPGDFEDDRKIELDIEEI